VAPEQIPELIQQRPWSVMTPERSNP